MPAADRMPPIPHDQQSAAQQDAAQRFKAVRGNAVFGPFVPLHRSPELMLRFQAVGSYCRYENSLGLRLSEFIILMVARRHSQDVEWDIHAPIARQAGVAAETIAGLREGRRPALMSPDETLVFDTLEEIWRSDRLSEESYAAFLARFGERGLVDLVGTAGYYATIAMMMNVARTPPPGGTTLPRFPD
jgi:4-carboxymuconolactone decarboxylase